MSWVQNKAGKWVKVQKISKEEKNLLKGISKANSLEQAKNMIKKYEINQEKAFKKLEAKEENIIKKRLTRIILELEYNGQTMLKKNRYLLEKEMNQLSNRLQLLNDPNYDPNIKPNQQVHCQFNINGTTRVKTLPRVVCTSRGGRNLRPAY